MSVQAPLPTLQVGAFFKTAQACRVGKGAHSATNIDSTLAAPLPTMQCLNVMKSNGHAAVPTRKNRRWRGDVREITDEFGE
jgi:hypothetical protein